MGVPHEVPLTRSVHREQLRTPGLSSLPLTSPCFARHFMNPADVWCSLNPHMTRMVSSGYKTTTHDAWLSEYTMCYLA